MIRDGRANAGLAVLGVLVLIDANHLDFVLSPYRRRTPRAKNPARGDVLIGGPRPTAVLFVFQRRGGRAIRQAGQTRAAEEQEGGGDGCGGAQILPDGHVF